VGPCLGRPSDAPGNLSGVCFGQQRFKDFYSARIQWNTKSYKRLCNPNLTQEFQVHFEPIHEHSPLYLKKRAPLNGPIQCLVGGCIGRIRMYKSIGYTKLLLYTNKFSWLLCVVWSVQELVVHPRRRRRTLGGLT